MKDFELVKREVEFVNNYFSDNFFINVVYDAGMEEEFEDASYDTIEECNEYLQMFYEVFDEYVDKNFVKELRRIKIKKLKRSK